MVGAGGLVVNAYTWLSKHIAGGHALPPAQQRCWFDHDAFIDTFRPTKRLMDGADPDTRRSDLVG